jgi:hypothetical protein
MKHGFTITLLWVLCSCQPNNSKLYTRIDSLEKLVRNSYKPGLGEFMSSIQVHHNKLWFAGEARNWKLADFEIHEITEAIEGIEKYETEREETKKISMIKEPLDSVGAAIAHQDFTGFRKGYQLLTNTCNECHEATHFEFNTVKIPDKPPFSNQDFKPR